MFETFTFSQKQVDAYFQNAWSDFNIAAEATVPEVIFRFTYDALIKLAISLCAAHGLRVKSQQGHHIELIKKLAEYLGDPQVEVRLNKFRQKRNWNLYYGGATVSEKEAQEYLSWARPIFAKAKEEFNKNKLF